MELSLYKPGSCPVKHSHGCGGTVSSLVSSGEFSQYRADGQTSTAIGLLRDSRCPRGRQLPD